MAASPTTAPRPRRRRPFGLYAILFLMAIQAIVSGAVLAVVVYDWQHGGKRVAELSIFTLLTLVFLFIVSLITVYGLWARKSWGWSLLMLTLTYSMAVNIWSYFQDQPNYVAMLGNVLMVFYLNLHEVRSLFIADRPGG